MSKQELVERTRAALKAFEDLSDEEQVREMIRWGTINEKGEVVWGQREQPRQPEQVVKT